MRTIADAQVSFKRWDTLGLIATEFIKWAALFGIAWMFYKSVGVLAGRSTFADIAIRLIGNVKVSDSILAFVTASGWVYGVGERRLRRRHIERTTTLKNRYEYMIDPKRTSSDLTPRGTTPKKGGK